MQLVIWQRQGKMLDLKTRFLTSKTFFITLPPKVSTFISGTSRSLQPVQTQLDLSTVFTRLNHCIEQKLSVKAVPEKTPRRTRCDVYSRIISKQLGTTSYCASCRQSRSNPSKNSETLELYIISTNDLW